MTLFVVGDIHGRYDALCDVIQKSDFTEKDVLVSLGDIVDGGRNTKKCIDFLVEIPNKVIILGNHDDWFCNWFRTGKELPIWVHQGGYATMYSYGYDYKSVPKQHIELFENAKPYFIDDNNNIYVHGGFDPSILIEKQSVYDLTWDRNLCEHAHWMCENRKEKCNKNLIKGYRNVFVGHTTTQLYGSTKPLFFGNLVMCDTGAGWNGFLTIMNVETLEYWQSEKQNPNI